MTAAEGTTACYVYLENAQEYSDGSVRGVGAACIGWAFERCGHLRIDTHNDNVVMQRLLEKLGFERRGTIFVREDNDPRIAYEKSGK